MLKASLWFQLVESRSHLKVRCFQGHWFQISNCTPPYVPQPRHRWLHRVRHSGGEGTLLKTPKKKNRNNYPGIRQHFPDTNNRIATAKHQTRVHMFFLNRDRSILTRAVYRCTTAAGTHPGAASLPISQAGRSLPLRQGAPRSERQGECGMGGGAG